MPTVFFDHAMQDFATGVAPSGTIIPFGVSTDTGMICHQVRPRVVNEAAFTKALQELLNSNPVGYRWRIKSLVERTEYQDWLMRMERVTAFDFTLEQPNPHYYGNRIVEKILEEFRAEHARLAGVEKGEQGVNVSSESFQQALDHVLRNYGRVALQGVDPQGTPSRWVKMKGLFAAVALRKRVQGVGGEEIPEGMIREALSNPPVVAGAPAFDDDDSPVD
jgi:hypothetical protein